MAKYIDSKVIINQMVIKELTDATVLSLYQTADAMLGQVVKKEVIPFDIGTLQNESTYVDDSHVKDGVTRIVSNTPYARRLYFHPEYNFSHKGNANAKERWFDDWIDGKYTDFAPTTFAKLMKKNGGL